MSDKAHCSRCQVNPCEWVFMPTNGAMMAWSCGDCLSVVLSWFEGDSITVLAA